jgi:pantoate--beta-alanine ligase
MIHNEALTVARTIADTRRLVGYWRARGFSVGLVPTMGSLHAGHLALVERAQAQTDRVMATIFVNPLQFGPSEDFAAYPRDEVRDFHVLRDQGCDAVFAPAADEMFPDGGGSIDAAWTRVSVAPLAAALCGAFRPGHFEGVATIVVKLFAIVQPDAAYFGEKDYQQLTIIRRMVRDLCLPLRVEGVPIVREADGLARSSRNTYLTAEQRRRASQLAHVMTAVRARIAAGEPPQSATHWGRRALLGAGFDAVDYLTLAAGDSLQTLTLVRPGARLFAAAWLGRTRLIDNIAVGQPT